jgi:hypothetical protein
MANAGVFIDLNQLCSTACQQIVEIKNTEVVAVVPLVSILDLTGANGARRQVDAEEYLNIYMEDTHAIMDDTEELDEQIAYELSGITAEDTNDGGDNFEPVLKGRSPIANAAPHPAAANTRYTSLITFVNLLRSPEIAQRLLYNMTILNAELQRICLDQAFVYNNILFFNPAAIDPIKDTSLFPKYSFNILCRRDSFLLPQLLVLGERGIGSILQYFVCNVFNVLFQTYTHNNIIKFKIVNPTDTNKLWQVKLTLFGNEFTFISIQIISMDGGFFRANVAQNDTNRERIVIQALCFSLYNKCLSKDFNCLCSLSELDIIKLFRYIWLNDGVRDNFATFVKHFLDNLSETQLNIKKQYFIMGLYNLASCSSYVDYTPETRAYELLFNPVPRGLNLFHLSMCFIKQLNQQNMGGFSEQIRFAMGGGKLYSIFHKTLKECCQGAGADAQRLRPHVSQAILEEFIKAAADADLGCFYDESGVVGLGASSCMAICMLLQLSLKQLIETLFTPAAGAAQTGWESSEIDIGNSCIGTPPTTLSSLRIILKNILRFYLINHAQAAADAANAAAAANANDDTNAAAATAATAVQILQWLQTNFNLYDSINIKAIISPYDFVMKGSLKQYIDTGINHGRFPDIAELLSKYCMITNEGFSSPLKGILDIFYTLFIIENFANRTFVTQKINKELKRVAICAQILALHYRELPPNDITQEIIPILEQMITYGFDPRYNLLNQVQFDEIMLTYVGFVIALCNICIKNINYLYFSVIGEITLVIGGIPHSTRADRTIIESTFMNLLEGVDCNDTLQLPVFQQTLAQYNNVVTALATMSPTTTALYHNKLYASCRDAENKKEGMVAIMSAYQKYLWNSDDNDRIITPGVDDTCQHLKDGSSGIIQCLLTTPNVFNNLDAATHLDSLIVIVNIFVLLGDILNLGDGNVIGEYTFADTRYMRLFLVFSWFITSIFGVKTKSKNTKVIALGRTYLQLLRGENLTSVPNQGALNPVIKLFGCPIDIPAADVVGARARQPMQIPGGQGLLVMVDGVDGGVPIAEIQLDASNAAGRLCLAYNQDNLRSAISKYIRIDIGKAAIDASALAAASAAADAAPEDAAAAAVIAAQASIGGDVLRAQWDVQLVAGTNIISVNPDSHVFKEEIFMQLISRFSHLRRGNEYTTKAFKYMKAIMRRICFLIDARRIIDIPAHMDQIREFYSYGPNPHDTSKFTRLDDFMKNLWIQYLLSKIFNQPLESQIVFYNMKLLVLLYNYIGPLTQDILRQIHPHRHDYLDTIGPLIDESYTQCRTSDVRLVTLSDQWEMEEPRVIAAAAAAAAAALRADTPAPPTRQSIKALERDTKHEPGAKAHKAAAEGALKKDETMKKRRGKGQSGGNRQNRTRKNKNKRKKNSKSKSHKPNPKSKPKSRKSKSIKSKRKNVTFKRRRRSNRDQQILPEP